MIFVLNVLTIKEVQGLMHLKRISIMKNEDNCLSNRIKYHTAFLNLIELSNSERDMKLNELKWNIFYLILWTYQGQKSFVLRLKCCRIELFFNKSSELWMIPFSFYSYTSWWHAKKSEKFLNESEQVLCLK